MELELLLIIAALGAGSVFIGVYWRWQARTTKRKMIFITCLICLFCLGFLAVTRVETSLAQVRAYRSCQVFETFCMNVRKGNWPAAQAMVLEDDPHWFRVEPGAVYYWDTDITRQISRAQPLLTETFKHRYHHPMSGNVVYFGGDAYVEIERGKIKYIKIP